MKRTIETLNEIADMIYSNAMHVIEDPSSERFENDLSDELEVQIASLDEYCDDKDNFNITPEEANYLYDVVINK